MLVSSANRTNLLVLEQSGGGGGANTKVLDMYGVGGVFSGPKTQK